MALIGQGAQGVPIDYSAWSNSAWNLANANAGAVAQVGAKIEGMIEQRKKNKDTVKVSADKIDAAIKLFGDQGGYLTGIRESLKDEDVPLSQRAALGGQIDEMLNLGIDKMRNDAMMDLQKRQVTVQEGEFEMRKRAADFDLGTAEEARAEQERITEFTARPILENVLRQTQEAEARGESPLIPSEKLKLAFLKSPKEQSQIAATAYQGLPKPQPVELREVGFTRDGQPMKGTAVFDPQSGTFNLVPVRDPSEVDVSGLPPGLAGLEKDFEEAGAKYGVDPKLLAAISIHETAGGTSNAFRTKNNAMGISDSKGPIAVASPRESIERMARLLGSTTSGPYKGAQTIDEIAKIYAPPGAGNDPRNLNPAWSGSVKRIMEELGGDPSAPIRIQPGATTARQPAPQTPEQKKKAELELAAMESEAKAKEISKQEIIAQAETALSIMDQIPKHPGFEAEVGAGFSKTILRQDDPIRGTARAGARALIDQIKAQAFLDAIQQMKGLGALSNAEGATASKAVARLESAQSEEDFKKALAEYRQEMQRGLDRLKGMTETSVAPPADNAARLRALRGQ